MDLLLASTAIAETSMSIGVTYDEAIGEGWLGSTTGNLSTTLNRGSSSGIRTHTAGANEAVKSITCCPRNSQGTDGGIVIAIYALSNGDILAGSEVTFVVPALTNNPPPATADLTSNVYASPIPLVEAEEYGICMVQVVGTSLSVYSLDDLSGVTGINEVSLAGVLNDPWGVTDPSANAEDYIMSAVVVDISTGSPTLTTPYPDLTNLPGDAGQKDFSSDWFGAASFQISGLPQGAHQVESSFLVDFTFPSVNGWYELARVNVVALSSEGVPSQVESFNWTVSDRMAANFTQKPQVLSDPFDDAGSPVTVLRGAMASAQWSQVSFKVFDAAGDPTDSAVGVISGESRATGQGDFSDFATTIDLDADDWVFLPNQAAIEEFRFSVAGLTADFTVVATVTSWN